jgi:hypothetical protein
MSDWDFGQPPADYLNVKQPSRFDGASYPYPISYPLPDPLVEALQTEDTVPPSPRRRPPAPPRREAPTPPRRETPAPPPRQTSAPPRRKAPAPPPRQTPAGGRPQGADGPPRGRRDDTADTVTLGVTESTRPQPTARRDSHYPWPPAPYPYQLRQTAGADTDSSGGRRGGGRRRLILGGIAAGAATAGVLAVTLTGGHPGAQGTADSAAPSASAGMAMRLSTKPSSSPRATATASATASASGTGGASGTGAASAGTTAPLSLNQAEAVVAKYTSVNNSANTQRSKALLATVETGSSYAIDAGQYQAQSSSYPPFSPVQATYFIPSNESATGPRWFVVQVANAFQASPSKVTSDEYLLFTQATPGGAWQNSIEPYLVDSASTPEIEVGTDGLATAVSPDATTVTVAPSQLPAVTAGSLDGTSADRAAVAAPDKLADQVDTRHFESEVPGAAVADTHAATTGAGGQEFALLTTDGGALVFYTDTAEVTITPPTGSVLHLNVPGFYSSSESLTEARLAYLEQFAAYDPPAASGGTVRVVANYCGTVGTN